MEFAMREWLTVIIVLLIAGVLLDGWRRMRQSRQQSIRMSKSMGSGEAGDSAGYGSELPNGGARVVAHRDDTDTKELTKNLQDNFEQSKTTTQKPARIPEQVALNLDEHVPMLMDSVVENGRQEPSLGSEPIADDIDSDVKVATAPVSATADQTARQKSAPPMASEPKPQKSSEARESEEVLVINVMSVGDDRFQGSPLLGVILECGMRYGDMKIFHRHLGEDGDGPLLFSMVNMVVPGTFDLNTMDNFETPGVSLFMTLPMDADGMAAFDAMASTAKAIAEQLGGELKDENRSVMTAQTLEHCRARIREFQRKQLV
ncbi:MAG: cell division protein ZipA [Cellvibrionaceae bacterium]